MLCYAFNRNLYAMNFLSKITFLSALSLSLLACNKDDDNDMDSDDEEDIEYILSSQSIQNGTYTLQVVSELDHYKVGYNELEFRLKDNNNDLVDFELTAMPLMQMMTMAHSCPTELDKDGKEYEMDVVFVMPSGDMGNWSFEGNITVEGETHELELNALDVLQPEQAEVLSFVSSTDSATYFVTLIDPMDPEVGQNDITLMINKRENHHSWPKATDLSVEFTPTMPSMEHGSPNNTMPILNSDGTYEGEINFTMTGHWQVDLNVFKDGVTISPSNLYFDIMVP